MKRNNKASERHFHELPLVFFTTLGIAGAGVGSAHLLLAGFGSNSLAFSVREGSLLSVLLLLGLVLSAGHLGKPLRGPLALTGVGRSPLSNEILALGIALGSGVMGLLLSGGFSGSTVLVTGSLPGFLGLLASLASVGFLLALGSLYNLPGRLSWQGSVVACPLVLGTAWGLLVGMGGLPVQGDPVFPPPLAIALAADGVLVVFRILTLFGAQRSGEAAYPRFISSGTWLLGFRLFLSAALAPLALLGGVWWLAVLGLSLALFLDRVAFYLLALFRTTESEVARVEALL
jgi:hypothetical protein